jgi:hypothetical protein
MIFRDARRDEVPRIAALLAGDELGAGLGQGCALKLRPPDEPALVDSVIRGTLPQ